MLALPAGIELVSTDVAQRFMINGFQVATTVVVFVLLTGTLLAFFQTIFTKSEDDISTELLVDTGIDD